MKAFLIVLLLAFAACKFPDDLINVVKCIIRNERVKELLPKALEAVKNRDFLSLVQTAIAEFPKVKEEIKECLNSEPILTFECNNKILYECNAKCKNEACLRDCVIEKCYK